MGRCPQNARNTADFAMRGAPKRFPARLRLPGAAGFPKTTATGCRIWGHGMAKMVIPVYIGLCCATPCALPFTIAP